MKKVLCLFSIVFTFLLSFVLGNSSFIMDGNKYVENDVVLNTAEKVAYIPDRSNNKRWFSSVARAIEVAVSEQVVVVVPTGYDKQVELTRNVTIKEGVTLYLPTAETTLVTSTAVLDAFYKSADSFIDADKIDDNCFTVAKNEISTLAINDKSKLKSTLEIKDNIILTNNGNICIGGEISAQSGSVSYVGQTGGNYARILMGNNSKIVQSNSSSHFYCYGYVQESSSNNSYIDLNAGTIYIPFAIREWKGGGRTSAIQSTANKDNRLAPFNRFNLYNIFSTLTCKNGSFVKAIVNINATLINHVAIVINFYGNNSDYFFQSQDSNSYFKYKLNSATFFNQVDIYGNVNINSLEIKVSTYSLSTSGSFFAISCEMGITCHPFYSSDGSSYTNSIVNISNQWVKIMPGGKLIINEGVTLNTSELIVYNYFIDDSDLHTHIGYPKVNNPGYVYNKGTINASGNIGGLFVNDGIINKNSGTNVTSHEYYTVKEGGITDKIDQTIVIKEKYQEVSSNIYNSKIRISTYIQRYSGNSNLANYRVNGIETIDGCNSSYFVDKDSTFYTTAVSNIDAITNNGVKLKQDEKLVATTNNLNIITCSSSAKLEMDVLKLNISDSKNTILVGETLQLTPTYNINYYEPDLSYEWNSSDTAIATISSNGLVKGISLGSVTITLTELNTLNTATYVIEVASSFEENPVASISLVSENKAYETEKGADGDFTIVSNITAQDTTKDYTYDTFEWTCSGGALTNKTINGAKFTFDANSTEGAGPISYTVTLTITNINGEKVTGTQTFKAIAPDSGCFTETTRIMMADGTYKMIKDIDFNEKIMSFNHETGKYEATKISIIDKIYGNWKVLKLKFSNGEEFEIITEHGIFDKTLNRYEIIDYDNVNNYIGHEFVSTNGIYNSITKLESYETYNITGYTYSIASWANVNAIAEGLLTVSDGIKGLYNFFEYQDDLSWNPELMKQDIETYGLYEYSDWQDYISLDQFEAFAVKYLKISIGKGLVTEEELFGYIEKFLNKDNVVK